jgi:Leucine-rich repeat (LRR) protein
MVISSQGEACSPNDDIKALDLNGTNALRDRLLKIQANSGSGEEALLAGAEIDLEQEKQARQVSAEQEKVDKIEEARQALQDFRNYLALSTGVAADALPSEEELEYSFNYETQECEITHLDGHYIPLNLSRSNLQGELPLPPQLMVSELNCSDNQITALPELPASLTALYCWSNQLTALPELPDSLTLLTCSSNQLTALPELTASLTELYCSENQLTALTELTASLTKLDCRGNQLTALPELTASLTKLDCRGNQLTALPELPDNLNNLYCSDNQLTTLPELPASLTVLECYNNQLTNLPVLPDSLTKLYCDENPSLANDPATQAALQAMRDRGGNVKS